MLPYQATSPHPIRASHFIALIILLASALGAAAEPVRTTLSFDADWRFYQGEPPAPTPAQPLSGNYAPIDPASFAFIDDSWRKLDLPHDWSIEGPFDKANPTNAAGGFLPSGVAWYRKTFTVPPEAKGRRIFVEFDGVMANFEVYLNKCLLGSRPNGYLPVRYELTDIINHESPNLLVVRTDTSRQPASRWYSGAGIYRHTRLVFQNPVHIEHASTFLTTPVITKDNATIRFETAVVNQSEQAREISVRVHILNNTNSRLGSVDIPARKIPAGQTGRFSQETSVPNPRLWDTEDPFLYTAEVEVIDDGKTVDEESQTFGIRTAEFRSDTGFWLNGRNLKILGVCLHHDAGGLGAAVPASAWVTRLTELKKYGVNAIRTAHAAMSPEFYDICDRLGLLVMNETFDAWTVAKLPGDYHLYYKDWWKHDLEVFMKRDRNHPSIVLWSLGNEIWDILPQNPDPASDQFIGPRRSIDIAKNLFAPMKDLAHQLDPSRPVTIAAMRLTVSEAYDNGFADMMDVIGQNYRDSELAAAHVQNPARKIIGTENQKTLDTWIALRDNPALAGQFIWTGADYLGESGDWPNVVGPSGILDRTNYPKGQAFERKAWWSKLPTVHITRMVNIPTRPGRPNVDMGFANWTPVDTSPHTEEVVVHSNCDEVELFLNDQSLGSLSKDPGDQPRCWQVDFAPGKLRAIGKNNGIVVVTDEIATAGAPAKLMLQAERTELPNDWDHAVYVRAFITDAKGTINPNANHKVKFSITGPGKIIAVDNGDITSHESFQANERSTYHGTCIAILQATADTGAITLTATAENLNEASVTIQATAAQPWHDNPSIPQAK